MSSGARETPEFQIPVLPLSYQVTLDTIFMLVDLQFLLYKNNVINKFISKVIIQLMENPI